MVAPNSSNLSFRARSRLRACKRGSALGNRRRAPQRQKMVACCWAAFQSRTRPAGYRRRRVIRRLGTTIAGGKGTVGFGAVCRNQVRQPLQGPVRTIPNGCGGIGRSLRIVTVCPSVCRTVKAPPKDILWPGMSPARLCFSPKSGTAFPDPNA